MIDQKLKKQIINILKPHHPKKIGVFGSYARGEQTHSSDLDILVEFNNSMGLIKLVQLQNELSDTLGVDVDLITENSISNPHLKNYILRDLITIFHEEGQPHLS